MYIVVLFSCPELGRIMYVYSDVVFLSSARENHVGI